jgi:solute:Na+ symporter, SSS family
VENWVIISAITFSYLAFVLYIGVRARTQETGSSLENYVAHGRSLGLFVLFFIMGAEIFSAFAFLGGPGQAYSQGAPSLYIIGYLALGLLPWWVLGPKTARLGKKHGYLTQAELISDRFSSKGLSAIIAFVSIGAFIPYLTIQIIGAGFLFEASTEGNIPFWLGGLVAFVIVTVYVVASGLRGIGWTAVIQGILMVVVAWVVGLTISYEFYGGVGEMFREVEARAPEYLTIPGSGEAMSPTAFSTAILVSALGFVMWPHLFNKSYGANSEKTIKKTIILYPLYGYLLVPLLFVGFAGVLVFADQPLDSPDAVLTTLVLLASLPPWLVGVLLSGALAAAMSTGANLAHTAASIVVRDFYVRLFEPAPEEDLERRLVRLTRISVVAISVVSYLLALINPATIQNLLLGAYGAIVQLLPLVVALFFWRRATTAGAYAGLLSGTLVMLYFSFFAAPPLDVHAGIWGLAVNTVLLVGVSLITKPMDARHVDRFVEDSKIPLSKISDGTESPRERTAPSASA